MWTARRAVLTVETLDVPWVVTCLVLWVPASTTHNQPAQRALQHGALGPVAQPAMVVAHVIPFEEFGSALNTEW